MESATLNKTLQEFQTFIARGNVMDLAVGVIVGAAFGKIVDSLVKDMIMPVVGLVFGKLDFSSYFVVLSEIPEGVPRTLVALREAGLPVVAYGSFITVALNFLILAFIVFLMVKKVNQLRALADQAFEADKKKVEEEATAAPPAPPAEDIVLLREIRDALKKA